MRGRAVVALALALVVVGAACSKGDGATTGRLTVDGQVELTSPGQAAKVVRGNRSVGIGQRIKVVDGTAVLHLDRGRQLELRVGSEVELGEGEEGSRRVVQPVLVDHDALVKAPPGAALTVSTEGAGLVVSGSAQLSRGPVLVVTSYVGAVELRSGTDVVTVPALRQVSLPAGGVVPDRPSPLSYDSDDPWDRRFLSDAFELGSQLEARSTGFSAQVSAAEALAPDFLVGLLPDLASQSELTPALLDPGRAPGESLVGAAIVLQGTHGTFAERWAGVFGFRQDGAQWGLVALDQGVSRVPLLAAVDAAISRGPRAFVPIPLPETSSGGEVALPVVPTTLPTGSPTTAPTPTVPVPTTAPQATGGAVGPLNTGIPILDATVNALVATLSGLLRSLGGG